MPTTEELLDRFLSANCTPADEAAFLALPEDVRTAEIDKIAREALGNQTLPEWLKVKQP